MGVFNIAYREKLFPKFIMKIILVAGLLLLGLSEVCCFYNPWFPLILPSYGMLGYGGIGYGLGGYGKGYGGYGKGYGGYGLGYGGIGDGKGYGHSVYKRSTDSYSPAPRHETTLHSSPVVVINHKPDTYSNLHHTSNSYAPSYGYSSYSAPSYGYSSYSAPSYGYSSKYVCYPWPENANKETDEGQPDTWRPPKDCSEIEAFYKKLDDADQMYDKMEKIISDAEQKFGIREPVEPDNVIPPEFEDLTKRFDDIDFKCRFRRRQQVRPSLRSATFFHNTSPDWESKECLEEEASTKKFYTTRRKMHDDDPDAGKIIDEMEKIVSEAEKSGEYGS